MKGHKVIVSKMTKMEPLLIDPFLSRHIPETKPFDQYHLEHMLDRYSTLFIKPDKGKLGNEVFRLRRIDDQQIDISSGRSTESFPLEEAFSQLHRRLNASKRYKRFIIQQGIDLATFQGRPFDFRIVMVKPADRWCLGLMSAKVARSKDAVVTNVAKGADEMWIDHVLRNNDQKLNATDALWELIDVSHQIAQVLGSHFPFRIIGLDMAIDKKGHVWFIEANTDPALKGMDGIYKSIWKRYKKLLKSNYVIRR